MGYVFLGGFALLLAFWAYRIVGGMRPASRANFLRWGIGGSIAVLTAALAYFRRLDLAVFTGAAAVSVLRFGRLGPFDFRGGGELSGSNVSKVRSRFFAMALDHDTGEVAGKVIAGRFAGVQLLDLGEEETRVLIEEVTPDPDSLSLLQSWLNANRAGWREYFEEKYAETPQSESAPADPEAEALAVLGLSRGASAEEIRAAHHRLMKAVHPDHGGSSHLAAKINQARDLLLKSADRGA